MNVGSDDAASPAQKLLSHHVLPTRIRELLIWTWCILARMYHRNDQQTTKVHLFHRDALTADDLAGRLHGDFQKRLYSCRSGAGATLAGMWQVTGRPRRWARYYRCSDGCSIVRKWRFKIMVDYPLRRMKLMLGAMSSSQQIISSLCEHVCGITTMNRFQHVKELCEN